jgi:hypothetical protein
MPSAFEYIAKVSVAASATQATLSFTSIPQTYKDLYIILSNHSASSAGTDTTAIQFNSSTSSYSMSLIQGYGNAGQSGATITGATKSWIGLIPDNSGNANYFGSTSVYIPNYSGTLTKGFLSNTTDAGATVNTLLRSTKNLWTGTAAITQIDITVVSGGAYIFSQYTNAYLYGIKNT